MRATQAGPEDSSSGTNSFPLGAAAASAAAASAAPPAPEEEPPSAAPPPPPPPPPLAIGGGDLLPPDDFDELPPAVDGDPLDFDLDQDLTLPLKVKENLKALVQDFPQGLPVMQIAR